MPREDGRYRIKQKINHLNPASWKGDVQLSSVHLILAWKSGQYLIESDPNLALFKPRRRLEEAEQSPNIDLSNPFGMDTHKEAESKGPLDPMPQQPAKAASTSPLMPSLELEVLDDSENVNQNGLESMIEVEDGK